MEENRNIPQLDEPHVTDSKPDQKPSSPERILQNEEEEIESEEETESEEDSDESLNPNPNEENAFELVRYKKDDEDFNHCEAEKKGKPSDSNLIFNELIRYRGLNADLIKEGVEIMDESERLEFERRWKKLHIAEMELFTRRAQLVEEQTTLIVDALKTSLKSSSSNH